MSFSAQLYRDTHKQERKDWLLKNKVRLTEYKKEYDKVYKKLHPFVMKEKYKIAKKIWHEKHKERRSADYKLYRLANPERMKIRDHNRSILEKTAGKLTVKILQMVYEDNIKQYGTLTCYLCLQPIEFKKDHLEHKTPLSKGGTNQYDNLGVACCKCNTSKKNKTELEYREWLKLVNV